MPKILTITLNPSIDKSTTVEKIEPDSKLRCTPVKNEAGGGGINVSKALKELGVDAVTLFPAGGNNGEMLFSLLKKEGITSNIIKVEQETRENFMVVESSTKKQFRFIMPGEPANIAMLEKVLQLIRQNHFDFIVASGSLPPGLPDDAYASIAETANASGAKLILDTSGVALKKAVEKKVFMLKPNIGELAKLSDIKWLETDKVEETARRLIDKGLSELIAVSMGKDGAMLVTRESTHFVKGLEVEKKSTVGAGDSMVAGMVYMIAENKPLEDIVRFGVACGTAATMNPGSELFHRSDADDLFRRLS
jgi:6-phosphofructokinase 2